ncbi:MAG: signal peptidase I [Nanoarchaeota archaeon]
MRGKKPKKKPATTWGKIWYFIWDDNSVLSWIVNIVLAYVLIKFLVYPGLGLLFGTTYPIVAVVSTSMEHPGGFDAWWGEQAFCANGPCTQSGWYAQYDIDRSTFEEFPLRNGFKKGDIMFLLGTNSINIDVGDVIVFRRLRPDSVSGSTEPIIHRVTQLEESNGQIFFQTKGDNNPNAIRDVSINEVSINEERVVGRAVLRIPYLGWVKIGFVNLVQTMRGWL